jgi:phosphoglycolate phosphatase
MSLPPIVVFDLDGTLAETAPDIMRTLNVILVREGPAGAAAGTGARTRRRGRARLIERGFKVSGQPLDPQTLERLFEEFLEIYAQNTSPPTAISMTAFSAPWT